MKVLQRLGAAGLAGALLSALVAGAVFAYAGQVAGQVTVAAPTGPLTCGTPLTVAATVLDVNGKPFTDTNVTWSFKAGTEQSGDKISPTTSMTNSSGVATTDVTLACVTGTRTVQATSGTFVGGAVLGITATGLPATSTLPTPTGEPLWMFLVAAAAVVAGLALMARQVLVRR